MVTHVGNRRFYGIGHAPSQWSRPRSILTTPEPVWGVSGANNFCDTNADSQSVACSPSHQQSPYRSLKVIYIVLVAQWLHTIYTLPHHGQVKNLHTETSDTTSLMMSETVVPTTWL